MNKQSIPFDEKKYLEKAKLLQETLQVEEAIQAYQYLLESSQISSQTMIDSLLGISQLSMDNGQFDLAEEYLKKIDKPSLSHTQTIYYWIGKANLCRKKGMFDETHKCLDKAIAYGEKHQAFCKDELGFCYAKKGGFSNGEKAKYWSDKAYELLKDEGDPHIRIFCFYARGGAAEAEPENGLKWLEKAAEIAQTQLTYPEKWTSRILMLRAMLFLKMYEYEKAIDTCLAYEAIQQNTGVNLPLSEQPYCFNYHAKALFCKGDYFEAIFYAQKALMIGESLKQITRTASCNVLAAAYRQIGNYVLAIKYGQRSLEIFKENNPNWNASKNIYFLNNAYHNLAQSYTFIDSSQAIHYYYKGLEVLDRTVDDKNLPNYFEVWRELTALHPNEQGLEYAHKALKIDTFLRRTIYLPMGNAYFALGNIEEAIDCYTKSLNENMMNQTTFDIENLELKYQFTEYKNAIQTLSKLGEVFLHLYQKTQETNKLEKAIKYFEYAVDLFEFQKNEVESQSQIILNDEVMQVYGRYLKALSEQKKQDNDKIFRLFEKNKASILHQSLVENQIRKKYLDESFLQKEKKLKVELRKLEKAITQIEDEQEKSLLYDQFFNKRKDYQQFLKTLENQLTKNQETKHATSQVSLKSVQNTLEENEKILNYLVDEHHIFIFFISPEEVELMTFPKPKDLETNIEYLLQAIHKYDEHSYREKAKELYLQLIAPIEDLLFDLFGNIQELQDLIIIPYGILAKVPFESLMSYEDETILESFNVSYHYSTTLWMQAREKAKKRAFTLSSFLGMAPIYENQQVTTSQTATNVYRTVRNRETQSNWTALPYSKVEVETIAQLFEKDQQAIKVCLQEEANVKNLKKYISQYQFVHLAAHFYQHEIPQLSGLILGNHTELLMDDVYDLDLQAQLVVLSACESGVGKVSKSEGMMAMTRGLLYAGAQNIVTSLFEVNDEWTSKMMITFYQEIFKGHSFKLALANAKRDLMEKEKVPVKVWAAFTLIGH